MTTCNCMGGPHCCRNRIPTPWGPSPFTPAFPVTAQSATADVGKILQDIENLKEEQVKTQALFDMIFNELGKFAVDKYAPKETQANTTDLESIIKKYIADNLKSCASEQNSNMFWISIPQQFHPASMTIDDVINSFYKTITEGDK